MLKLNAVKPSGCAIKPVLSNVHKRRFARAFDFYGFHRRRESVKGRPEKGILVELAAGGNDDLGVLDFEQLTNFVFVLDAKAHQRV